MSAARRPSLLLVTAGSGQSSFRSVQRDQEDLSLSKYCCYCTYCTANGMSRLKLHETEAFSGKRSVHGTHGVAPAVMDVVVNVADAPGRREDASLSL